MTTTNDANAPLTTSAKIIADSISPGKVRLTTFEVTFHRFVLAELNTHRVFSRNSASSRAVPAHKRIAMVRDNPAMPVKWGSEKPGMQSGDELEGEELEAAKATWLVARDDALSAAQSLMEQGLHKQVANRILEPFMWHTAIVTATEWDGFFNQRCSPDMLRGEGGEGMAQPEIRVLADLMYAEYHASRPSVVDYRQWHLPYLDEDTRNEIMYTVDRDEAKILRMLREISAARCARVSYLTHDGRRDFHEDLAMYKRLTDRSEPGQEHDPVHWSPLEHVATPCLGCAHPTTDFHGGVNGEHPGNFKGWVQMRHDEAGDVSPYVPQATVAL